MDTSITDPAGKLHIQAKAFEMLAESSDNVVGYFMSGSYGMGFTHGRRNLDPVFIVKSGKKKALEKELSGIGLDLSNCEITIYTHSEFKSLDLSGTSGMGSTRYDYVHARAAVDKTGDIQSAMDKLGRLSEKERIFFGEGYLDAYITGFYRSLRASRENWQLAPHLEASRSIINAIDFIFASEGRITPYPKYLEWELNHHPVDFMLSAEYMLKLMGSILSNIDARAQTILFDAISIKARSYGFGHIIDKWARKPEEQARQFR